MGEVRHECGIAALYYLDKPERSALAPPGGREQIVRLMPRMLLDLQNRGQLAAGITSYHPFRRKLLITHKRIGTVIEALRLSQRDYFEALMKQLAGPAVIGHVRYATCGSEDPDYAQPFERYHGCRWKWFSFAFNGQLANYQDLKDELLSQKDYHLTRDTDTEVIMHYLSYELRGDQEPDLVEVFHNLSQRFEGAYNIVYLNARGDMVVARDPLGFRPLVYAVEGPLFAAASESVALTNLGFRDIRVLEPGQMVLIQDNEIRLEYFARSKTTAHCFFEWIYFANAASNIEGRGVYSVRCALGRELAWQEKRLGLVPLDKDTIVVPVPDTGKAAADAMAYELGLPSVEGLMRNRYVGRTFIQGEDRASRARMKYTPLREVLAGKRVLLVEDTIVRSTTMKALLEEMRRRGEAREIHVRVACPPIIAPCFYGIDMSTVGELFAPRYLRNLRPSMEELRQMAAELGADSLLYLPIEAVARCIGLEAHRLCQACITAHYPTPTGERLYQLALKNSHRSHQRTYELSEPVPVGPTG
ncbi:MAG: amidophosphoribosyltransferase [Gemmatales bacterium]|nr:amidophosphoribosyltransferase [Gemmatales bacterium]MDW7994954.1 amidophosphoribosyltransferase [Gemmatales bacterium]